GSAAAGAGSAATPPGSAATAPGAATATSTSTATTGTTGAAAASTRAGTTTTTASTAASSSTAGTRAAASRVAASPGTTGASPGSSSPDGSLSRQLQPDRRVHPGARRRVGLCGTGSIAQLAHRVRQPPHPARGAAQAHLLEADGGLPGPVDPVAPHPE